MQGVGDRLESANRIASVLAYIASVTEPWKVHALVEYLGDLVDPLTVVLLQPHFCSLADKAAPPGLQTLKDIVTQTAPMDSTPVELKLVSSEERKIVCRLEPGVEEMMCDTVFGDATVSDAVKSFLSGCSDIEAYLQVAAFHTLPCDLAFVPRRAASRAYVLLQVAQQTMPDSKELHFRLALQLYQALLKVCHFEFCLDHANRYLHDTQTVHLAPLRRVYLETCRAQCLSGLGEIAAGQDALQSARAAGEMTTEKDSSALCLALAETYRLGLLTGDMTGLPHAGQSLLEHLDTCKDSVVWSTGVSFVAIWQTQLGNEEASHKNARVAVESARERRLLDVEVDVRNREAKLYQMQGAEQAAAKLVLECVTLYKLSDNAHGAYEGRALLHERRSRDAPCWPNWVPPRWEDELPAGQRTPFVPGILIAAGGARDIAGDDPQSAAAKLWPAIQACERVRELIPDQQVPRFLATFIEVYRLFLDLPMWALLQANDYESVIRDWIELFAYEETQNDQMVCRALLQSRFAHRAHKAQGKDKVNELILLTSLDPDNPSLHIELASEYFNLNDTQRARESCEKALALHTVDFQPHRLLGLLAMQTESWDEAVGHFAHALACGAEAPRRVSLEYAEALFRSGRPFPAIQLLESELESGHHEPLALFLAAGCYSSVGNLRREGECLLEFIKEGGGGRHAENARRRLRELGRADDLAVLDRSRAAEAATASNETVAGAEERSGQGPDISDATRYRACSKCGRLVFDLANDLKRHTVIDSALARISGLTCAQCRGFFCVYPCSLQGCEPFMRLCPKCRHFLVGVLE